MNRKEGVIVGLVLLVSFVGGVLAAPAIQQTLIVNDPLNVRIVGGTQSLQTTSVDIHVLGPQGVYVQESSSFLLHNVIRAGFSFAPDPGFVQVDSVLITIAYSRIEDSPGDMFSVSLNGQPSGNVEIQRANANAVAGTLLTHNMRVGSNLMEISVAPANPSQQVQELVFEVRLTVEFRFMA